MKIFSLTTALLFTGLLGAGPGDLPNEKPRFELVPGYEVCSLYLNHCRADSEEKFQAELHYRPAGEADWLPAPPAAYQPPEKSLRGSLLNLKENTPYQIKLVIRDDGHEETITRDFRTKTPAVPIAVTIILDENTPMPLKLSRSGKPDGYLRYTMKPGTHLDGGIKAEYAVFLNGVSHVILDGLAVRGGQKHAIMAYGCTDIRILNCDVSGFGRTGTHRPDIDGKYYENDRSVNQDAGIRIRDCRGVLVERNYVHDPRGTANSWFHAHPEGPNGLNIGQTREAAIRYNDFIGGDAHRWNDAVEGLNNSSVTGSAWRDAEITGNNFFFANDDGMELDGGQVNARFFGNKIEGTFCGLSTAPCLKGPTYVYRNLFASTGTEFGFANIAIKNIYGNKGVGRGRLYFFNNTIAGIGDGFSAFGGNKEAGDYLRLVSRSNLVSVTGVLVSGRLFQENRVDFDHDLLYSASKVRSIPDFRKEFGQEKNGVPRKPLFTDEAAGSYTLRSDSPGFKENVGAYTFDHSTEIPYRPVPVTVSANRLHFDGDFRQVLTVTASVTEPDFSTPFQIRKNEAFDFLRVTPESGVLEYGKPVEIRVSIAPEKLRTALRHSAAFLIRLPDGFSRAVAVYADSTGDDALLARDRRSAIHPIDLKPLSDKRWQIEFDLKQDFRGYLFGRVAPGTGKAVELIHNDGDALKLEFRSFLPPGPLPVWKGVGTTNLRANPQLKLKAGKHRFILTLHSGSLLNAALAEKPETFLCAPHRE